VRKNDLTKNCVWINGRFLGKPITGTQRFAREILFALDEFLTQKGAGAAVTVVAPQGIAKPERLKVIQFMNFGARKGHAWEQIDLSRATRGGTLLNLEASGVLFKRDQLTVIHDAALFRRPKNFSLAYRTWHTIVGFCLSRFSRLATVSRFSQGELANVFGIDPASITVVYNGHEHMLQILPDEAVWDKLGVRGKPYFLFVGSPTPNKNLMAAVEAFQRLGRSDVSFVLVGAAKANVFSGAAGQRDTANIIRPGRLSDEEIAALYKGATALVFPSLYEGFGIPPLEAMVHGCPVVASRIPAVEEVCADAALYFDPYDIDDIAAKMRDILSSDQVRQSLIAKGTARYKNFSWMESARRVWEVVRVVYAH